MPKIDPWDKRENESMAAYRAFRCYMEMEPTNRSMTKAWRQFSGKPDAKHSPGRWHDWSAMHEWRDRVAAWDSHNEKIAVKAIQQSRKKALRDWNELKHQIAQDGIKKAYSALLQLDEGEMKPQDIVKYLKDFMHVVDSTYDEDKYVEPEQQEVVIEYIDDWRGTERKFSSSAELQLSPPEASLGTADDLEGEEEVYVAFSGEEMEEDDAGDAASG